LWESQKFSFPTILVDSLKEGARKRKKVEREREKVGERDRKREKGW
jgi:hypothetical protein